jgi:hypothetical protein
MPRELCRFSLNVSRGTRTRTASAHISLQRVVRHANGMLSVTPVCGSLAEIEKEIEELRGELEAVRREARRAFGEKGDAALPP